MANDSNGSSLRTITAFAGGNLVATALGLVTAVAQSRFVDPATLGYFKRFGIPTAYLVFLSAGTTDILSREFPYLLGKGDRSGAERFAASCQAWTLLTVALCVSLFVVLALHATLMGDPMSAAGWLTQIAVAALGLYGGYLNTTFRTAAEFKTLTASGLAGAVVGLVTLIAVWLWPFGGLCLKTALSSFAALAVLYWYRPVRVLPAFNWPTIRYALRTGVPLSAVGYLDNAFARAAESTLVLTFLGSHSLGLFSLTQTAFLAFLVIPVTVGMVYLPRFAHTYGTTHHVAALVKASVKPTAVTFGAMTLIGLVAFVSAGFAVRTIAPTYAEAIPAIQFATLIGPIWALRIPGLVLYAAGRTAAYALVVVAGLVGFAVSATVAVVLGWGLVGVVGAIAVGGIVRAAVMAATLCLVVKNDSSQLDLALG